MPMTPHTERHFTAGEAVRDVVIGMSDGLTVPFALAEGLSGTVSSTRIVVTAGLAEIVAGSIAMGLGGYLAARSDADLWIRQRHLHWSQAGENRPPDGPDRWTRRRRRVRNRQSHRLTAARRNIRNAVSP